MPLGSDGFNVSNFKANILDNGFLQTNKYDVQIDFSADSLLSGLSIKSGGQSTSFQAASNDLTYRCIDASIPGIAIRSADVNRYGLGIIEKMPYSGNYTDMSLTFLCDRYGSAYNFWYAWINYVFAANGKESKGSVNSSLNSSSGSRLFYTNTYKDEYSAKLTVTVYDNFGDSQLTCNIYKAFPVALNDSKVSWGDNNNLMKISATLSFREWDLQVGQSSSSTVVGSPQASPPQKKIPPVALPVKQLY